MPNLGSEIDRLISEIGHAKDLLARTASRELLYCQSLRYSIRQKQDELRYFVTRKVEAEAMLRDRESRVTQRKSQLVFPFEQARAVGAI